MGRNVNESNPNRAIKYPFEYVVNEYSNISYDILSALKLKLFIQC